MGLIAIVDDDHVHCELLSMALAANGRTARSFSDGASFLHAAAANAFDLVLLDWSLPDMPGGELLRALHAIGRRPAKTIVLSGRSEAGVLEEALTGGASVFLLKPTRLANIVNEVEKLMNRQEPPAA